MSAFASGVEGGKKYRNQEGDDGDYHKKFDETRKCRCCAIGGSFLQEKAPRGRSGVPLKRIAY